MARGDYGPEIKDAIGSAPKGKPRVGPTDTAKSPTAAPPSARARPPNPMQSAGGAGPSGVAVIAPRPGGGIPPDLHHVAAAASIAHAILNRTGGSNGGPM